MSPALPLASLDRGKEAKMSGSVLARSVQHPLTPVTIKAQSGDK